MESGTWLWHVHKAEKNALQHLACTLETGRAEGRDRLHKATALHPWHCSNSIEYICSFNKRGWGGERASL